MTRLKLVTLVADADESLKSIETECAVKAISDNVNPVVPVVENPEIPTMSPSESSRPPSVSGVKVPKMVAAPVDGRVMVIDDAPISIEKPKVVNSAPAPTTLLLGEQPTNPAQVTVSPISEAPAVDASVNIALARASLMEILITPPFGGIAASRGEHGACHCRAQLVNQGEGFNRVLLSDFACKANRQSSVLPRRPAGEQSFELVEARSHGLGVPCKRRPQRHRGIDANEFFVVRDRCLGRLQLIHLAGAPVPLSIAGGFNPREQSGRDLGCFVRGVDQCEELSFRALGERHLDRREVGCHQAQFATPTIRSRGAGAFARQSASTMPSRSRNDSTAAIASSCAGEPDGVSVAIRSSFSSSSGPAASNGPHSLGTLDVMYRPPRSVTTFLNPKRCA